MAEQLQLGDHICAFVTDANDGLDVIAQTVAAGLDAGDRVMVFAESLLPGAVLAGLERRGIAASVAQQAGQVQVLPAREAYLPNGRFEASRMLENLAEHIDQADRDGYRGLRVVGDMAWALAEPAGLEELCGYEARVNSLFMDGRALAVCLYDQRALSRRVLQQVTCAHPGSASSGVETGWAPLLRIRRTMDPYGLQLVGEADLSNRHAVVAALDAVLEEQPDPTVPIVVDLAALRFADAAVVALLGRAATRAPTGMHLNEPQTAVAIILEHIGFSELSGLRLTRSTGDAGRPRTGGA
jgi:anti-anti-sigma regulatory factor